MVLRGVWRTLTLLRKVLGIMMIMKLYQQALAIVVLKIFIQRR